MSGCVASNCSCRVWWTKPYISGVQSCRTPTQRCLAGSAELTADKTCFLCAQYNGELAEHQVAVVLFEVLQVVAACHRRGVCHGDIKPANFLMSKRPLQVRPLVLFSVDNQSYVRTPTNATLPEHPNGVVAMATRPQ